VTPPILLDNTVLSNLAVIHRTDLVVDLWGSAGCTSAQALAEYEAGTATGVRPSGAWAQLPVLELTSEDEEFAASLPMTLGPGERACLALAVRLRGFLVSDDADARRIAIRHGVIVTGTVGILRDCVREGHLTLDQANRSLATMIDAGYFSPVARLDELLNL
jgi:predicted nucleic acid-binding protein